MANSSLVKQTNLNLWGCFNDYKKNQSVLLFMAVMHIFLIEIIIVKLSGRPCAASSVLRRGHSITLFKNFNKIIVI